MELNVDATTGEKKITATGELASCVGNICCWNAAGDGSPATLYALISGGAWDQWPLVLTKPVGENRKWTGSVFADRVGCAGTPRLHLEVECDGDVVTVTATDSKGGSVCVFTGPDPADEVIDCDCDPDLFASYGPFTGSNCGTACNVAFSVKVTCDPLCVFCLDGVSPGAWDVDIGTMVDDGLCDFVSNVWDCSAVEGIYRVATPLLATDGSYCTWSLGGLTGLTCPGAAPGVGTMSLNVAVKEKTGGNGYQMEVLVQTFSVGLSSQLYTKTQASPFDCSAVQTLTATTHTGACIYPTTIELTPV